MKKIILYPVLFAFYPVMNLYLVNANQLVFSNILDVLFAVLIFAVLIWGGFYLLLRDWTKSAIATSIFLFLFFTFGYLIFTVSFFAKLFERYDSIKVLVETRSGMFVWLVVEIVLVALLVWWLAKTKRDISGLNRVFNLGSVILISVMLMTWIGSQLSSHQVQQSSEGSSGDVVDLIIKDMQPVQPQTGNLPDIYYIILDGYGRQDILESIYGIDNQEFMGFLESKGFYIAEEASSNYMATVHSISSTLNFMYLDEVANQIGLNSKNIKPLSVLVADSRTFQYAHQLGYKLVNFSSGWSVSEISTADQFLAPDIAPDDFQMVLINNTPLSIFLLSRQYDWHRDRIRYSLDQLPEVARDPQPTFVFAHILAPHPPFVFGLDGESIHPDRKYSINDGSDFLTVSDKVEYISGYRNQLMYITGEVETAIEAILTNSSETPIIVIQGDHGPGSGLDFDNLENTNLLERHAILSAYLFPPREHSNLYPSITPVNTFRVLFNEYFHTQYPLLEDRNYYSTHERPYGYVDVTERIKGK